METNFSSSFSSHPSKLDLTPGTTSITHKTDNAIAGSTPESTNDSHSNGLLAPATSLTTEGLQDDEPNGAPHIEFLATAFHSSFDADSSLHGRLQEAPHKHPNPYSRIGCYTVKAQQLIDNFDKRFDPSPDNSPLNKPV